MENKNQGKIIKISGPLVVADGMQGAEIYETVEVSSLRLLGEIIELREDVASIQVYENTSGISPGEPVYRTGKQLSVSLGPGLVGSIYDGIQRPLDILEKKSGVYIDRGIKTNALDIEKKWQFKPILKKGDKVSIGDIIGEVKETEMITHKIISTEKGEIISIDQGNFTVKEPVVKIKTEAGDTKEIIMEQIWPIRKSRLIKKKLLPEEPLITGQRVIDTFFPIAKGGAACIPGPFGAGKTIIIHQISKWADVDIIVLVGCGERGNEMTDVLKEFPELKDPKTKRPLMERTVLIANTSNMPVAAREASIYTGITIAEYFRDMGYSVAFMADSTSRWAEALREMSSRLEEMPGEEGYPAYLGSRTASFYERAGYVECLSSDSRPRKGMLTVIGSVSPPGGDLSEPVTQNTLRCTKVFWGLEDKLAYARHFPAINWLTSYSLYLDNLIDYFKDKVEEDFIEKTKQAMKILNEESKLEEIVRLVGFEALSGKDRLIMETAKSIREDFLMQNAFEDYDSYTSLKKQYFMLKSIIDFYDKGLSMVEEGKSFDDILKIEEKEKLPKLKFISEEKICQ